jgi:hypothetical protein
VFLQVVLSKKPSTLQKNASGSRNTKERGGHLSVLLYFILFLGAGSSKTLRFPSFPRVAAPKTIRFLSFPRLAVRFPLFPRLPAPKTIRFPLFPRLAAQKRYVP